MGPSGADRSVSIPPSLGPAGDVFESWSCTSQVVATYGYRTSINLYQMGLNLSCIYTDRIVQFRQFSQLVVRRKHSGE
jgi:hypothetical protein